MTLVNHKYKLGSLVRGGEVSTFEAQEVVSGRSYYVHLLTGASASLAALEQSVRKRLAASRGGPLAPVVEQGDHEGKPYIVTLAKPELLDLKQWLDAQGPTAPRSSEFGSAASQPGEFTLLFEGRPPDTGAGSARKVPPIPAPDLSKPVGPVPPEPPSRRESPRMESAASPRNPTPVPPASSGSTGEFTQLFGQPRQAPQPPPTASEPPSPSATGAFPWTSPAQPAAPVTQPRRKQEIPTAEIPWEPAAASSPKTPEPTPAPPLRPAPSPPAPSASNTGEFTKLFQGDRSGATPSLPGASSPNTFPGEAAPGPRVPPRPQDATFSGAYPQDATMSGGVMDSGLRKISPEERREEMRQFRMISRDKAAAEAKKARAAAPADLPSEADLIESPPAAPAPPPASDQPQRPSATQVSGMPQATAPPAAPPPPQPPGEFTRLFRSGSPSASGQHQQPAPPAPAAPPSPPPKAPNAESWSEEPNRAHQSGEFTKLFRGSKPSSPGSSYPPASQPPYTPPAPPAASSPGEFTRQFGSGGFGGRPEPDTWSDQPAAPPQGRQAGDFTRIFSGGGGAPSSGVPGAGAPANDLFSTGSNSPSEPSHPLTQPDQKGDFTKLFGKGGRPGGEDWTGPQYAPPSGATQISREPSPYQPPPSAPPPPSPGGPGEFTRIAGGSPPPLPRQHHGAPVPGQAAAPPPGPPQPQYGAPPGYPQAYQAPGYPPMQQPPAAQPPVAQPPAAQPEPHQARPQRADSANRSMYLILALVFCGLLVAALAIVLFVVLTRPAEQATPPAAPSATQAPAPVGSSGAFARPSLPSGAPSVSLPSVSAPSVSAPSVTAPTASASGISAGSVSAPSVRAPSVSKPSISTPSLPSRLPSSGVQAPAGETAAAPSNGTPFLALIIVLSVLLVVAVGAAVFFALRR